MLTVVGLRRVSMFIDWTNSTFRGAEIGRVSFLDGWDGRDWRYVDILWDVRIVDSDTIYFGMDSLHVST